MVIDGEICVVLSRVYVTCFMQNHHVGLGLACWNYYFNIIDIISREVFIWIYFGFDGPASFFLFEDSHLWLLDRRVSWMTGRYWPIILR